jgi:hypothetical protein
LAFAALSSDIPPTLRVRPIIWAVRFIAERAVPRRWPKGRTDR